MRELEKKPEQSIPLPENSHAPNAGISRPSPHTPITPKRRSPKLPLLIAGAALLVLIVVLASVLSAPALKKPQKQLAHQPAPVRPITRTSTLSPPSTKPLAAAVTSGFPTLVTVADGVAYVGTTAKTVYALRTDNGHKLWSVKIVGDITAQPVVTGGVVYVATYSNNSGPGSIIALRASDGAQLWSYNTGNQYVYQPVVDNGAVYTASSDGVIALGALDGAFLWHDAENGTVSVSTVINGIIYTSAYTGQNGPGTIYALRASDGSRLWKYAASNPLDPPVVINGVAYTSSWAGTLYAFQATNGKQLWQRLLDGNPLIQTLQAENGALYLLTQHMIYPASSNILPSTPLNLGLLLWGNAQARQNIPQKEIRSSLYAIRAGDGAVLWRHPLNNGADSMSSWLVVDHGVIYGNESAGMGNSNSGDIFAMRSQDGALLWQDKLSPYQDYGSDQLVNGVLYISNGSGDTSANAAIYALRANDGVPLWSYPIDSMSASSTSIVAGTLYTGAMNGIIYALRTSDAHLLWHYQTALTSQ